MKLKNDRIVFYVCLAVAVALIVGGFITPPIGVIDGSVLTAVGELLCFPVIWMLPKVIKEKNAVIVHGDTRIAITDENIEDGDDQC